MGKKTVKVKYTDNVPKASMFCQTPKTLQAIYESKDLEGVYGFTICPLEHSDGGYFFYRKKLKNGEMLICGECYQMSSKHDFDEGIYYIDDDHEPNTIFFVDEPSLTDDDEPVEVTKEKKKVKKVQQGLQKLEESSVMVVPETRAYLIDVNKCNNIGMSTSDEDFITEAEKQGTVFTMQKFVEAFNLEDITTDSYILRIIEK